MNRHIQHYIRILSSSAPGSPAFVRAALILDHYAKTEGVKWRVEGANDEDDTTPVLPQKSPYSSSVLVSKGIMSMIGQTLRSILP